MEHLRFVRNEFLTIIINLVELLWYGAGLVTTPSWIYLIKRRYDLIYVIYLSGLDSSALSVVKFYPEVVAELALVEGNLS